MTVLHFLKEELPYAFKPTLHLFHTILDQELYFLGSGNLMPRLRQLYVDIAKNGWLTEVWRVLWLSGLGGTDLFVSQATQSYPCSTMLRWHVVCYPISGDRSYG